MPRPQLADNHIGGLRGGKQSQVQRPAGLGLPASGRPGAAERRSFGGRRASARRGLLGLQQPKAQPRRDKRRQPSRESGPATQGRSPSARARRDADGERVAQVDIPQAGGFAKAGANSSCYALQGYLG